tara:strand:- start:78 stop:242 length:165 start_codon:yes stop_codon:yes gene_type:complete
MPKSNTLENFVCAGTCFVHGETREMSVLGYEFEAGELLWKIGVLGHEAELSADV